MKNTLRVAVVITSIWSGIASGAEHFSEVAPSPESIKKIKDARTQQEKTIQSNVYFDYVEDGKLTGGNIKVTDANRDRLFGRQLEKTTTPPPFPSATIQRSGSPQRRIDVVIVGDGYTPADLGKYAQDASRVADFFFKDEIFREYRNYFNVYRVDVTSNDSGVDNDPSRGIVRDTALDMGFFCNDIERLLCVNTNKALDAARNASAVDQVIAIANSSKYGGAGYPNGRVSTASSNNDGSLDIAIHEFGHTFGDLADEYGGTGSYSGGEPEPINVSKLNASRMAGSKKKWHRWLGKNGVSTFEGAFYHDAGVFRPTSSSIMRDLGSPWGSVNKEQMILKIYKEVEPVDSVSPAGNVLTLENTYSVKPVQPRGRALTVQWWLDGELVKTGENTFNGDELPRNNEPHTLAVRVIDETPDVINEEMRQQLMTMEFMWSTESFNIPNPEPERKTTLPPFDLLFDE